MIHRWHSRGAGGLQPPPPGNEIWGGGLSPPLFSTENITSVAQNCFEKISHTLLGEFHKLLRLYVILSVVSVTCKHKFSALQRLKTYLRSTLKQDGLNIYLLLHCHKYITAILNTVDIAKKFVCVNTSRCIRLA